MPTRKDIILLAQYNETMNRQLYDAAATLPADEVSVDRGAFFGSLLGTMNHLLAGDTIWLKRFSQHPSAFPALAPMHGMPTPTGLTHSFGASVAELREHRLRLDGVITAMAAEIHDADLEQVLVYRNLGGKEFQRHFGDLLLHFFNHQTHHRGQASTLLSQAGADIGVTDLFVLLPDAALG
ncbi:DinB family protein [Massilia sp. IC2-477]|uniref:DinB family protein n=1 Tax=Massilia sp. IC2-477 TaxID=2887198 RepID=UPI001D118AA3|nr:DinB family protein [Massilia sp. IC2-477]